MDLERRCGAVLVEEQGAEGGIAIFLDLLKEGRIGLCIARRRISFEEIQPRTSIRLSHILGRDRHRPDQLALLRRTSLEFLASNESAAIFLEGIDYLVLENELSDVLKFLHILSDAAVEANALLIISLDPCLFQERELALLRRALDST